MTTVIDASETLFTVTWGLEEFLGRFPFQLGNCTGSALIKFIGYDSAYRISYYNKAATSRISLKFQTETEFEGEDRPRCCASVNGQSEALTETSKSKWGPDEFYCFLTFLNGNQCIKRIAQLWNRCEHPLIISLKSEFPQTIEN
jgi:hypothetical protein